MLPLITAATLALVFNCSKYNALLKGILLPPTSQHPTTKKSQLIKPSNMTSKCCITDAVTLQNWTQLSQLYIPCKLSTRVEGTGWGLGDIEWRLFLEEDGFKAHSLVRLILSLSSWVLCKANARSMTKGYFSGDCWKDSRNWQQVETGVMEAS